MYTFSEFQGHFAQTRTEQSIVVSHTSIVVRDPDKAQYSAVDQEINREKFKEWQNLKARLQGDSPSKKQSQSLKELFISSIPTPKTRILEKPSPEDANLVAFHELVSQIAIPRRPVHIPPRAPPKMAKKPAAKVTKGTKTATKGNNKQVEEDKVAAPLTPEPTSNGGDSDTGSSENESTEAVTPVASQDNTKKKAPVANMTGKHASTNSANNPAKRKSDEDGSTEGKKGPPKKKRATPENATPMQPVRPASCNDAIAFTSPVFDIFVGPQKYQFSAHQAILMQSPVLEKLCTAQAGKKGRAKTSLLLPPDRCSSTSPPRQLPPTPPTMPIQPPQHPSPSENEIVVRTAKKLAKLYCVGAAYELPELQTSVTRLLSETKLWDKLPGMEFFELAEKLYTDDPEEVEGDSFARFFRDHAPAMIRTVPQDRVTELLVMVSRGGPFAEAIFMAFNTAARGGFRDVEEGGKVEEEVGKGEWMGAGGEKGQDEGAEDKTDKDQGAEAETGGVEGGEQADAVEGASIFGGPNTAS
ncbi:hypothetical protein G7Y79_00006g018560 [Physcia stellaris]|nr:hypothetical protein G7Y79_00006g018560 [Physcia stellaris]